jgi:uncharacterized protein with GYD domain
VGTYLMLSTIGPEGAARLHDNPDRLKQVNADVESMGARVRQQWALLGPYDFATILEAPNEKIIARVELRLEARGTVKILTLTAIPIDDYLSSLRA